MALLHCSALHLSRLPVSPFPRLVSALVVSTLLVVSPLCSSPRHRRFRPLCVVFAGLLFPPRLPPSSFPSSSALFSPSSSASLLFFLFISAPAPPSSFRPSSASFVPSFSSSLLSAELPSSSLP